MTPILFDLDGTLVDSAHGIAHALNALRAERGGAALPAAAVRPLVALGAETLVARGLGDLARDPAADLAAFRRRLARVPAGTSPLYPGVRAALDALAGRPLAIVTNKPAALARLLLAELGIADRFGTVVGGDSAARPKPDPAPVRMALAALGARAAWFVGDSGIDAAAARACGLPFLLFAGGYGAADCTAAHVHARFDDYAALPALVAAVAGRGGAEQPREPALEGAGADQ